MSLGAKDISSKHPVRLHILACVYAGRLSEAAS